MKLDEFAFVNHQLAGMIKSGLPLEGALRQLCASLAHGDLRAELSALEADLAQGTPLAEGLARRKLPELYQRMLVVGVKSGDLPGVLVMVADYYSRMDTLWTRLRGLMVYPLIVLACMSVVSVGLALGLSALTTGPNGILRLWPDVGEPVTAGFIWLPVAVIGLIGAVVLAVLTVPKLRRWAQWSLPPFREASFARIAGAFQLLLRHGCSLQEAIALTEKLETGSPVSAELADWQRALAAGQAKPSEFIAEASRFPPLFRVLLAEAGDDLARGFARASETYQARATARAEMLLNAALPVAVLMLGGLMLTQFLGPLIAFTRLMDALAGS